MKKEKKSQKRRKILNEIEQQLYYQRPIFNNEDRMLFFSLTEEEFHLTKDKPPLLAAYIILQFGYFKAKKNFFKVTYEEAKYDLQWIWHHCLRKKIILEDLPSKSSQHNIKNTIAITMGYETDNTLIIDYLIDQANFFSKQHNDPIIIFKELFLCLNQNKMMMPGYTTMQDIISQATYQEEERLFHFVSQRLTDHVKNQLETILKNKENPNRVLDFKQDLSGFNYSAMKEEISLHQSSIDLYQFAKSILPELKISEYNIRYYAECVTYYSTRALNKLPKRTSYFYLLCFLYYRHQKMNNNLAQAFIYHVDKIKKSGGSHASKIFNQNQKILLADQKSAGLLIGKYANDKLLKSRKSFKAVANESYAILEKKKIAELSQKMIDQSSYHDALEWQYYEDHHQLMELNIRQIFRELIFEADKENHALLEAVSFLKSIFNSGKPITKVLSSKFPQNFIQKKMKEIIIDPNGKIKPYHYEFLVYYKLKDYLIKNIIYINDSLEYKSFDMEIKNSSLSGEAKEEFLKKANKPKLSIPIMERLPGLEKDIEELFIKINENIANGSNKSVRIKTDKNGEKTWSLKYPAAEKEFNHRFYESLPVSPISNVFDFVNQDCNFIKPFKHFIVKNVKGEMEYQYLKGGLIAKGTRQSTTDMASRSNLKLDLLRRTDKNYIREKPIREACKILIKKISQLPAFKNYLIDGKHFCGIDGSKKGTAKKISQARHSPKYFGLSIGLSAMCMVMDNMFVNSDVISCNEYEAHHLYDLVFNQDADFSPDVLTMDTHGHNGCNFPLFDGMNIEVYICYKNIFERAKQICGFKEQESYKDMLIKPKRKFDTELIKRHETKILDLYISMLSKSSKQSTLIKKLCNHGRKTAFKKAVWEYNSMFFTKSLLTYINDPMIQKYVRKSLNRGEANNKFYNAIVKVGGKKFKGKSESEIRTENQATRLLMLIITYYNMYILSEAIEEKKQQNDHKAVEILSKVSSMATSHLNFSGMYYYGDGEELNIKAVVAALTNALDQLTNKENKKVETVKIVTKEIKSTKTEVTNVTSNDIAETVAKKKK